MDGSDRQAHLGGPRHQLVHDLERHYGTQAAGAVDLEERLGDPA